MKVHMHSPQYYVIDSWFMCKFIKFKRFIKFIKHNQFHSWNCFNHSKTTARFNTWPIVVNNFAFFKGQSPGLLYVSSLICETQKTPCTCQYQVKDISKKQKHSPLQQILLRERENTFITIVIYWEIKCFVTDPRCTTIKAIVLH